MFRAARNAAGLSREEAAHQLYINTRTLSDYKTCRTIAPPDVVMRMAEVYKAPELTAEYCSKVCPIGQVFAYTLERSELAVTVLRVLKEFADVEKLKEQLIQIASDGKVCEKEEAEFRTIMKELVELEKQICELKYFALKHGIDVEDIMLGKEVA